MAIDLNGAPPQREGELIPHGTIAPVHLTIRPGTAGDGGYLRRSKDGESEAIDAELTITEGQFAKRKLWNLMTVRGRTDGHEKAAQISLGRIRAILESAYGIRPDDNSEAAMAKRRIDNYGDLNGLRFVAKIGIEKGKDNYPDRNCLLEVITPDKKAWTKVDQVAKAPIQTTLPAASANGAAKPAWA